MNQNTNQYMAEESIGKLMLRFSIPCIMSLLVSALYNIVDQIFIGRGIGFVGNGATNVAQNRYNQCSKKKKLEAKGTL